MSFEQQQRANEAQRQAVLNNPSGSVLGATSDLMYNQKVQSSKEVVVQQQNADLAEAYRKQQRKAQQVEEQERLKLMQDGFKGNKGGAGNTLRRVSSNDLDPGTFKEEETENGLTYEEKKRKNKRDLLQIDQKANVIGQTLKERKLDEAGYKQIAREGVRVEGNKLVVDAGIKIARRTQREPLQNNEQTDAGPRNERRGGQARQLTMMDPGRPIELQSMGPGRYNNSNNLSERGNDVMSNPAPRNHQKTRNAYQTQRFENMAEGPTKDFDAEDLGSLYDVIAQDNIDEGIGDFYTAGHTGAGDHQLAKKKKKKKKKAKPKKKGLGFAGESLDALNLSLDAEEGLKPEQELNENDPDYVPKTYKNLIEKIVGDQFNTSNNFFNQTAELQPLNQYPGAAIPPEVETKSARSTILTSRNLRHQNTQNSLAASNLPVVGLKKPEQRKLNQVEEAVLKLNNDVGTEKMIKHILNFLDSKGEQQHEWPADATFNKKIKNSLSFSRMMNEINHRKPRQYSLDGDVEPVPVCGSKVGFHSTSKRYRRSTLNQLGPGINLYFKMIKYFAVLFLVFSILTIPTFILFHFNSEVSSDDSVIPWMHKLSLGSLIAHKSLVTAKFDLLKNSKETKMLLECPEKSLHTNLIHFGLADAASRINGIGLAERVNTYDKCSLGKMKDVRKEYRFEETYDRQCLGWIYCRLAFDPSYFMDKECVDEIKKRHEGRKENGPPVLYIQFLCNKQHMLFAQGLEIDRVGASLFIVSMDLVISFIFTVFIIRLRYFEKLAINDIREGKSKIEDFTVFVKSVPINKDEYDNSPEMLKAMIAAQLEELLKSQPEINHIAEEDKYEAIEDKDSFGILLNHLQLKNKFARRRLKECDVVSINFGMTSYSVMGHLMNIQDDIREIQRLYQRRENDPLNQVEYERQIWKKYKEVTYNKNKYYQERTYATPEIKNIFITFRSMEGKQRMMRAYETRQFKRCLAEWLCCMREANKSKKLNGTGFYEVDESVDPDIIHWESIGASPFKSLPKWMASVVFIALMFVVSFSIFLYAAYLQRRAQSVESVECKAEMILNVETAYIDLLKPYNEQEGLLPCFCRQVYRDYGVKGVDLLFEDQKKHCRTWYEASTSPQFFAWVLAAYLAVFNLVIQAVFNYLALQRTSRNMFELQRVQTLMIFCGQYLNVLICYLICTVDFRGKDTPRSAYFFVGTFVDFNADWYAAVGTPLLMTQIIQIFSPHLVLFSAFFTSLRRCFDRRITYDMRVTRQVIQADYENVYTGPYFALQVREAQFLTLVFTTMTFSSGMPVFYVIAFLSLFITYWVDKFLLLRYYRLTPGFTKHLSNYVVSKLPYAAFIHLVFGFFMISYPNLLNTGEVEGWFGLLYPSDPLYQYFNLPRLRQSHAVVYLISALTLVTFLFFEKQVRYCMRYNNITLEDTSKLTFSNDIFDDLNFSQLYVELKKTIFEYQRIKHLIKENRFNEAQVVKCINPYVMIVKRNQRNIYNRLLFMSNQHIDRIDGVDARDLTDKEKIKLVNEYYLQATDKDNPMRALQDVDEHMHGRLVSPVQSYDLLDNKKYAEIDQLLNIMTESYGYFEAVIQQVRDQVKVPLFSQINNEFMKTPNQPEVTYPRYLLEMETYNIKNPEKEIEERKKKNEGRNEDSYEYSVHDDENAKYY